MSFGNYTQILNDFVGALVPGDAPITGLGYLQFFLVFLFLFAIIFSSTKFIPAFKPESMRNSRLILALIIAYFGATTFFTVITQYLEWFSFVAAIAIGLGAVLLAVIPKDKIDAYAPTVTMISFAVGILLLLWFVFQQGLINALMFVWTFILDEPVIAGIILVVLFVIVIIIYNMRGQQAANKPQT